MAGKIDGIALGSIAVGAVLTYAGVAGKSIPSLVQGLIRGVPPTGAISANTIQGTGSVDQGATQGGTVPGLVGGSTGGGSATSSPGENQNLAKLMAGSAHPDWVTGQQWSDWVSLWNQESGWSQYADTRQSGLDPKNASVFAYGIPQARPYTKMPKSAWPADKGGQSDPSAQIGWGIDYIAGRYGSPSAAWAHEQANGWY